MRVLQRASRDGYLALCFDADYDGNVGYVARIDFILGLSACLAVRCHAIECSRALLVFHRGAYHLGFAARAGMERDFDVRVSGSVRFTTDNARWWRVPLLDWFFSAWLLPRMFRTRFCLPGMRAKWLR